MSYAADQNAKRVNVLHLNPSATNVNFGHWVGSVLFQSQKKRERKDRAHEISKDNESSPGESESEDSQTSSSNDSVPATKGIRKGRVRQVRKAFRNCGIRNKPHSKKRKANDFRVDVGIKGQLTTVTTDTGAERNKCAAKEDNR